MAMLLFLMETAPKVPKPVEEPELVTVVVKEPPVVIPAVDRELPASNPYANPMPFGLPPGYVVPSGIAVEVESPDAVLFRGTGETNQGLLYNTIPDTSLTSRLAMPKPTPKDPAGYVGYHAPTLMDYSEYAEY